MKAIVQEGVKWSTFLYYCFHLLSTNFFLINTIITPQLRVVAACAIARVRTINQTRTSSGYVAANSEHRYSIEGLATRRNYPCTALRVNN